MKIISIVLNILVLILATTCILISDSNIIKFVDVLLVFTNSIMLADNIKNYRE